MAITFNRVSVPTSAGASPVTLTITSSTGNLLIGLFVVNSGVTISGITDSKSQTWTALASHGTSTGGNAYIFYKLSSLTGVTSITVTMSATGIDAAVIDCGSTTGGALDTSNSLSSQTTNNPAPSLVAAGAGICTAVVAVNAAVGGAGAPFTDELMTGSNITGADGGGHDVNGAGGTLTCTFTGTVANWSSSIAAFKEASASTVFSYNQTQGPTWRI
jgi:hypothetical protein